MISKPLWHPILFSGPMVRAIQDGRKAQTRRSIRGLDPTWHLGRTPKAWLGDAGAVFYDMADPNGTYPTWFRSPYGKVGHLLWVKETWWMCDDPYAFAPEEGNVKDYEGRSRLVGWDASMDSDSRRCAQEFSARKRSSRFMPRWASRITLRRTGARYERVSGISDMDIMAEGVVCPVCPRTYGTCRPGCTALRGAFQDLWDSINAKRGYGWDVNSWVEVVEFEVVSK